MDVDYIARPVYCSSYANMSEILLPSLLLRRLEKSGKM